MQTLGSASDPMRLVDGAWAVFEGVPVFDGTCVEPLISANDGRVLLGVGPSGGDPVAYVYLCPCDGVQGLVRDLQEAGALAAEHHPPHGRRMSEARRRAL